MPRKKAYKKYQLKGETKKKQKASIYDEINDSDMMVEEEDFVEELEVIQQEE